MILGLSEDQILVGEEGRLYRVTVAPTHLMFFVRFSKGLDKHQRPQITVPLLGRFNDENKERL